MPRYDLVAFDLDGTVYVNHARHIRPRVLRAFEAAHEAGVMLAVASGRPQGMLGPDLTGVPWLDWSITVNGACVSNVKTGEVASARMMPLDQALDIVACVRSIGSGVAEGGWSLFAPGVAGFDRELNRVKFRDRGARADGSTNFSFVENALANGQEVEEIPTIDDALAGLSTDVYKLGIMLDTVEETDAAMDALRASSALGDLELALTGPTELEITQMGVNKGSALSILCEKLGVDESRAVAFGDSGNDATFADSACTFVAMGNATPEIKAVADEECPADADDGVAVWIEENILA